MERPEKRKRERESLTRLFLLGVGFPLFLTGGTYLLLFLLFADANPITWHPFARVVFGVVIVLGAASGFGFVVDNYFHVKRYGRLKDKYEV